MLCPVAKVPFIRNLTLKGFRSISADQIELDNPAFLVGENGSGKSNLADAFAFLAEAATSPLDEVIFRRGGISAVFHQVPDRHADLQTCGLSVEIAWDDGDLASAHYSFELEAVSDRNFEVISEHGSVRDCQGTEKTFRRVRQSEALDTNIAGFYPLLSPYSLALPVAGGLRAISPLTRALSAMTVYAINPTALRTWRSDNPGLALRADGGNAANVLRRMLTESELTVLRIDELLSTVTPHELSVRPVQQGRQIGLQFTQTWGDEKSLTLDSSCMSDGVLRALSLLIAVFQEPPPPVMVIEKPEATMHPKALGLISDLIQLASRRSQVIVTTHSPELLDAKWIEDRHLRIVSWEKGSTRVRRLSEGSKRVLQAHLAGAGELLRTNSLDVTLDEPASIPLSAG